MHDLFPKLLAAGLPVMGFPIQESLIDIGTKEKYLALQQNYEFQPDFMAAPAPMAQ